MDNEESISYHLGEAARLSGEGIKDIAMRRSLLIQSIVTAVYHITFIVLAFALMHGDSETLWGIGFVAAPAYILAMFIVNFRRHIPWQVFWIFTAGAAAQFILNAARIIPGDVSIVLSGFEQSLWCAYVVLQVNVLFLFTLIPYLVYRHKAKRNKAG